MRKYLLFASITFGLQITALAQTPESIKRDSLRIDSLQNLLPHLHDTARINCLNSIAEAFINRDGYKIKERADSASNYAVVAYNEAQKTNFKQGLAYSLINLCSVAFYLVIDNNNKQKDNSAMFIKYEEYISKLFKVAAELNDNEIWAATYYSQADFLGKKGNKQGFIEAFKKSLSYFQKSGDEGRVAEISTWLCMNYSDNGEYEKGFDYCKLSLELAKKRARKADHNDMDDYLLQQALMNMSDLYIAAADYETALDYLRQTQQFYLSHKSYMTWSVESNLGEVFRKMGLNDSALRYEKPINPNVPVPMNSWAALKLGDNYYAEKNYDSAILMYNRAIAGFRKNKNANSSGIKNSLTGAAKVHIAMKNYSTAFPLVRESLSIGESEGNLISIKDNLEVLSDLFYRTEKIDSAYLYLKRSTALKDSIFNKQFYFRINSYKKEAEELKRIGRVNLLEKDNLIKAQQLQQQILLKEQNDTRLSLLDKDNKIKDQELQIKDQELKQQILLKDQNLSKVGLLDKENKLKDQRLKQQATIRNALLAGLLLLLALGIFVFRSLSLKRKNERLQNEKRQAELQQKASELEMQALRAQMNPHFIFNCLSSINKFILKNDTDIASDYLTRFSRLIRQTLTNSQLTLIPLSDEIETLRLYLDMERLRFSESFTYNINFENSIEPETIYVPPMLLQPFCENAIWHGLMHKDGQGKLELVLSLENGHLRCIIADNGIGREKAKELKTKVNGKQKSFGLKITTERLALFNNERSVHDFYKTEDVLDANGNVAGTKITLNIKIKNSVPEPAKETV